MNNYEQFIVATFALVATLALVLIAFSTFRMYQMAENERHLACETFLLSNSSESRAYDLVCK